ncbi:PTS sugar transporter [Salmonella enterica subsp. enterica]|nr:PTS sugar transporter [Salmonella enterica subsp. enterica]
MEATSTTWGGAEPEKLLQEIYQQCEAAGVNVAAVQFIAAEASMDVAKPDTPASVYALTTENQQKPQRIFQGQTFGGKHLGSSKAIAKSLR